MGEWTTMATLFDTMRAMTVDMMQSLPDDQFDEPIGQANSAKWITGHLALGMDFGLMLLGQPTDKLPEMMPTYGPGSSGGKVGDDGRTRESLIAHFQSTGDQLGNAIRQLDGEQLSQPNETPFFAEQLPTIGDLLGHIVTTHLAMHMGQLSQIRRQQGLPSIFSFG